MPTEVLILAGALVIQGCYIMYQHSLITRYKRLLNMAAYALEGLLIEVLEEEMKHEDTDS